MPFPGPSGPLRLTALNHVSRVCKDVQKAAEFYEHVLGFVPIQRPSSFEFEGAWMFNLALGLGFHLVQNEEDTSPAVPQPINPKADHLSFQSDSLAEVKAKLSHMNIPFRQETVLEAGIKVTQVFFHDPDNNMIEICNCDCLPIRPLDTNNCAFSSAACRPSVPQRPHAWWPAQRSASSAAVMTGDMDRAVKLQRAHSPDSPLLPQQTDSYSTAIAMRQ